MQHVARSTLQQNAKNLAGLIGDVLRNGEWKTVSVKANKALSEAARAAREAATLLDAAGYLDDKILSPCRGRIVDLHLKEDFDTVQSQIIEKFDTHEAPRRGFVYVAWSRKPERFYYVGKVRTTDRLKLALHGKLARATAPYHATLLSLLFPTQSQEDILSGVEASAIRLIEHQTGALPKLNKKREKVPEHAGSIELQHLADFLRLIGDDVHQE